jgi:hypothetical protein
VHVNLRPHVECSSQQGPSGSSHRGHMTSIAAKHPAQALRARVVTGESFVPRTHDGLTSVGFSLSAWLSTIDVAGMGRE